MYFILRQHCCDESKIWSRGFAGNDKKGYETLEEAKRKLKEIENLERIEKEADLKKEIFMAEAEGRDPKKVDDGWYNDHQVVVLLDGEVYTKLQNDLTK
jgi:hypothetical protein